MKRVAVLGGGIAGLAAAHRLHELARERDEPLDIVLFESSDRLGGAIGTERIPTAGGDYLCEGGADMFITDKPWAAKLCERLGIAERLLPPDETHRRSMVLRRGKPEPVPEGFLLMAPTQVVPMITTPILSPWGKLRMAGDLLLPRGNEEDESLASFVRRRFGKELLDRLVQPLVGGIYTGDPERLSLRATLPRFIDMERAHRSVILATLKKGKPKPGQGTGARYNLFVGLPEGMVGLITALASRLPPGSVRLGTKVESLSREENGAYRLRTPTKEDHFDAVVVALPAFAGAKLLEPLDEPLATLLQSIPYASTLVVTSGHRLADSRHPLDAFGLVIPAVERRRVLAISFASRKFAGRAPQGRVLIRTFVGGALQPELADLTDAQAESLVLAELDALLGVRGKPDFIRVMRHARAMPQYEVGHLARIDSIDARLATHPSLTNVALAGNAYRGVGIPDCVHSGEQAADRIFTSLTRHAASGDARQSKSDQGARPRA